MGNVFDPYHRWLGISPKDQPPNHYRLLGIDRFEADPEVIRDAAEQRMAHVRTYHLGQYADLSQRILNELAAAKACLLDPQKKAAYDRQLPKLAGAGGPREPVKDQGVLDVPSPLNDIIDIPTVMPRPRPSLPKRPVRRQTPRWLPAATIGAITVAIVGVLFALTWNPASVPVARAPAVGKTVERTNSPELPPLPPKENAPTGTAQTAAKSTSPTKAIRPSKGVAEAQGPIAGGGRGVGGRASVAEKSPPAAGSGSSPGADAKKIASAAPKSSAKRQAASKAFRRPSVDGSAGLPFQLRLPSGETLSQATFDVPDHWQKRFFPPMREPMGVVYATFYAQGDARPALIFPSGSNGHVQGVFTCRRDGSLHGAAVTLDENGRPQTLASYVNGKLHGSLWLWSDNGEQRFYGQYANGKKNGFICAFEKGTLQLVQKCSRDKVSESYLVRWTEDVPTVTPSGELSADKIAELDKSLDDLGKLEAEIAQNERKLKNKLKTWVRRWQVALQAPSKAQRERERIRERAEQQQESAKRWADKVHGAAGQ